MGFSDAVRKKLSMESGGFCSNPQCRAPTGLHIRNYSAATGDAAHIVAENESAARGLYPLPIEERNHESNGVWLCPTCHRKVDGHNAWMYTVEELRGWKAQAPIWWQESEGRPLRLVAHPNERQRAPVPSLASLKGAKKFLEKHERLKYFLVRIFQQRNSFPMQEVPVSNETEGFILEISLFSSSWLNGRRNDEHHCDDAEFLAYMKELSLLSERLSKGRRFCEARYVGFLVEDELRQLMGDYISKYNEFYESVELASRIGGL